MAQIIDGKALAEKFRGLIKSEISEKHLEPGLAVVLVGNNAASQVYVRNKKKACAEVSIKSFDHTLPEETSEADLLKLINKLNADKSVHGILVQLPLPEHIDSQKVLNAISPDKDVDGFHPVNLGRLLSGQKGLRPCTPVGVMEMIDSTGYDLKGKHAVVVGRSNIVGKPVAVMLLERHATVTICHSRTVNLPEVVKAADVVVAALGKAEFVKGSWIKKGAVVIDVGINRTTEGKLVGDVEFAEASKHAGFISPVPGGVGPMTIAMLLKNTLNSCKEIKK